MKTFFALAIYYIAIGCLVAFAGVIIIKLIFWPPCTQMGHDCIVDGWSIAGLAGTVLAVAATVLAVLGAVAVAAWWTSLNERVNDQVKQLYEAQKTEVNAQVDLLLKEQQAKVGVQLSTVQTSLQAVEHRIGTATTDIDELEKLTHDVEEIVIDGLMVIGAESLEEWARRAIANHKFPRVPAKMTEGYLNAVARELDLAEREVVFGKALLHSVELRYHAWSTSSAADQQIALDPNDMLSSEFYLEMWLEDSTKPDAHIKMVKTKLEGALRWFAIAKDEKADEETLRQLEERLEQYSSKDAHLQQDYDQLNEGMSVLLQQIVPFLQDKGLISRSYTPRRSFVG